MYVKKRINNNVILAVETLDSDDEQILIGKGIGFQVYPKDQVPEEKIEKVFIPEDSMSIQQMAATLNDADFEDVKLVGKIVSSSEEKIGKQLSSGILFSLLDHLLFAFKRHAAGMDIRSPLEWEVKHFYPKEVAIGTEALAEIREAKQIDLPGSEAIFIALHLINYEYEYDSMEDTMDYLDAIKDITKIIRFQLQMDIDEQSVDYQRFLNHLRYYIIRTQLKNGSKQELDNPELLAIVQKKYPKEFEVSQKISEYLSERYHEEINHEENLYLTLHLARLLNK